MVVKSTPNQKVLLDQLDLPYLGFFLGLRVNELVMARTVKAGFAGVRQSHGYVIQHLIESDRTITELAKRMQVTQQAASKIIAELIRLGIVETVAAKDKRTKRIALSGRGWECVQLGRRTRAQIARRLMRAAGRRSYEDAKSVVLSCLQALGGVEKIRSRRIPAPQ